jgi:demethylmenaquinone methyltransferase/2-methoxy-6-polyprenyl-1,4-benzoquinol methylase
MFDDIVDRYDLLNTVLSMGLDRVWRRRAVHEVREVRGAVLDLGCGTGGLMRALGAERTVGVDVSGRMLARARGRIGPVARLVQGSAFALPFAQGSFGGAVSGFVLRNLEDLDQAFAELARVVGSGGRIALLDITDPPNAVLRTLFRVYFDSVAPAVGRLFGKGAAYRYLTRSLAQLPPPAEVTAMLERAGFAGAAARPLTGGVVTLFTGQREGGGGGSHGRDSS